METQNITTTVNAIIVQVTDSLYLSLDPALSLRGAQEEKGKSLLLYT